MYYTENDGRKLYSNECWQNAPRSLIYPPRPSLTTPTATPTTEPPTSTESSGDSDNGHKEEDNYECSKPIPPGTSNSRCVNTTTTTTTTTTTGHIPVPPTTIPIREPYHETPPTTPTPTSPPSLSTPFFEGGSDTKFESLGLVPAEDWPLNGVDIPGITLGQVSAVAVDKEGHVHVLHRGPVVWDFRCVLLQSVPFFVLGGGGERYMCSFLHLLWREQYLVSDMTGFHATCYTNSS